LKDVLKVEGQIPKGVEIVNFNALHAGGLTFDMSGGTRWAKPAVARPLDRWVRPDDT
jgi:hypothetical protein